ncbi:hypothetical protein PAMP_016805 [Pampus punctatissimus]
MDFTEKDETGVSVEMKPELQRVLESRKRDQLIKQRKQEDEAHRKISPLEAELRKRHQKLEELEKQHKQQREENLKAPEFVKVKENLRRTSFQSKDEKEYDRKLLLCVWCNLTSAPAAGVERLTQSRAAGQRAGVTEPPEPFC